MYISIFAILVIWIIWQFRSDKLQNEISELSDQISGLRDGLFGKNRINYESHEDFSNSTELKDKYEYTIQESKDRESLGVSYNANLETIKSSYKNLARVQIKNNNKIGTELYSAYKRLLDIYQKYPQK